MVIDAGIRINYADSMVKLDRSPIHSDPTVMGGTLVFRGTRVPVQTLLDYLDDGFSLMEFLDMFPSVVRDDAIEFLTLARESGVDPNRTR